MVRLYSNVPIHWSQIPLLAYLAPKYPGHLLNYHLYHVKKRSIIQLETLSPLNPLYKKRTFYCYKALGLIKYETRDILPYQIHSNTIYIPSNVIDGDIIVIEDNYPSNQPEVTLPSLLLSL